mgnify:CR=1 FL=1
MVTKALEAKLAGVMGGPGGGKKSGGGAKGGGAAKKVSGRGQEEGQGSWKGDCGPALQGCRSHLHLAPQLYRSPARAELGCQPPCLVAC